MNRTLVGLLLSLSCVSFAHSASEAQISKAEDLLNIMQIDKQMIGSFDALLPSIMQMSQRLQLDAKETAELKEIYQDWFNNQIDRQSIKQQIAQIYADTFTNKEMDDIIQFYQTPTGQKLLVKNPSLIQQGAQVGMLEAQNKQQQLMEKLKPFLEKHKK